MFRLECQSFVSYSVSRDHFVIICLDCGYRMMNNRSLNKVNADHLWSLTNPVRTWKFDDYSPFVKGTGMLYMRDVSQT